MCCVTLLVEQLDDRAANDSPANEDTVRAILRTFVRHHRMFSCEPPRTAALVVKIPSKVGLQRKAGGEERRKTEVH